jgi:methylated-DNA-[protein]-cysteine S-methyltransferase
VEIFTLLTPAGWLAGAWSERGLKSLVLPQEKMERSLEKLAAILNLSVLPLPVPVKGPVKKIAAEIDCYFRGGKVCFSTPVDWSGYTHFQRCVLAVTKSIPYGEVRSYGQVARAAGSPRGARAVGGVMRLNRTALVVPCHRVIAADGSLGGFGGGLEMKKYLLNLENAIGWVRLGSC